MKPEQLAKVVKEHQQKKIIDIPSRVALSEMCWLMEDLLEAEIKYLEENEPTETTTISEYKIAQETVKDLYHKIDDMETNELVKLHIWN